MDIQSEITSGLKPVAASAQNIRSDSERDGDSALMSRNTGAKVFSIQRVTAILSSKVRRFWRLRYSISMLASGIWRNCARQDCSFSILESIISVV